jgi:hypothetical protein
MVQLIGALVDLDKEIDVKEKKGEVKEKKDKKEEGIHTVVLTISVNTAYPSSMGYAIYKNGQKMQCYHIWIDNKQYTLVGIVYPKDPSHSPSLTDLLGILVAEQIRFDTLDVYLRTFPDAESLNVNQLYYNLFDNFKD